MMNTPQGSPVELQDLTVPSLDALQNEAFTGTDDGEHVDVGMLPLLSFSRVARPVPQRSRIPDL